MFATSAADNAAAGSVIMTVLEKREHAQRMLDHLASPRPAADVRLANHGSLFLLHAVTAVGTEWIEDHLPEDRLIFGGATVIEPRYVEAIVAGMVEDGLQIEAVL